MPQNHQKIIIIIIIIIIIKFCSIGKTNGSDSVFPNKCRADCLNKRGLKIQPSLTYTPLSIRKNKFCFLRFLQNMLSNLLQ